MHHLSGQKMMHSVVIAGAPNKYNILVELNAQHLNIPFKRFLKDGLAAGVKDLLNEIQPDVVFVFGCSYKIPPELFPIPKYGFFNVHFSLLPAYRGPSPLFWQIRNGETSSGITIHQMTAEFDTGPMLAQQEAVISPGETCGLFAARLSVQTIDVITQAIKRLINTGTDMLLPQNEEKGTYFKRPDINDLRIDWEKHSAAEIENLVNATNPDYGGATVSFRGQPFRILETNRVALDQPNAVPPGTIIHADINYGIIVACKDGGYIRINVAQISEGIFSGFKLAGLGIKAGEQFGDSSKLLGITINP
jgi:methionyl-tRNA formyltransferase